MNIYQKKLKSRNKSWFIFFIVFFIAIFAIFGLSDLIIAGTIHPLFLFLWMPIIIGIAYWFFGKPIDELWDEIKDIENIIAKYFWEDVVFEILNTFDEEELNKVLAIAKEKEQEEEIKETNITNEKLKDIKEKINHFKLKETKATCCC